MGGFGFLSGEEKVIVRRDVVEILGDLEKKFLDKGGFFG